MLVLAVARSWPLDGRAPALSGLSAGLLTGVVASDRAGRPRWAWGCAMAVAGTARTLLLLSGPALV